MNIYVTECTQPVQRGSTLCLQNEEDRAVTEVLQSQTAGGGAALSLSADDDDDDTHWTFTLHQFF